MYYCIHYKNSTYYAIDNASHVDAELSCNYENRFTVLKSIHVSFLWELSISILEGGSNIC
jgi:hypothetical protein